MSTLGHARHVAAGAAGFVFAIGLGVAGMTRPSKVAAFLDVTGAWDPSLALVMAGAIGVHFLFARRLRAAPKLASAYGLPTATRIDARLVGGAALFGVGWGTAGFCPGPALVSVASGLESVLAFVAAMIAGMLVWSLTLGRSRPGDVRVDASHQSNRKSATAPRRETW